MGSQIMKKKEKKNKCKSKVTNPRIPCLIYHVSFRRSMDTKKSNYFKFKKWFEKKVKGNLLSLIYF